MKLVVVDVQGFCLPEFIVKELAIYDGINTIHETFKSTKQLKEIDERTKKQARYLERYHHMLRFNDGFKEQISVKEILFKYIKEYAVEILYVKGKCKENYLRETLGKDCPKIVNLETIEDSVKLSKEIPACDKHIANNKKCYCFLNNAKCIYNWLYSRFPQ
ncbi:hypothetical protein Zmor_005376 [Zophobas morio]|uniref:Uncharacterized protein n=1 Tax=Zophobas morio TaxID=2755281 RepID=A0AA38MKL7_9CUCU|nr:hypothetical protein Zmor_005376 [Zophobas morio]